MKNETNRRNFLKKIALASGLIWIPPYLQSCNSCNKEGEETATVPLLATADVPFGIWRQMIEVLEKSPDHLIGRRKALIATKDPIAMTEFVRDNFQILPQIYYFMRYTENSVLHGVDGALRSGMATPREKAEILKDMLVEAGFEARVVNEYIQFSEDELKDIVFRTYQPEFDPKISKEQMKSWKKSLGADSSNGTFKEISDSLKLASSFENQFMEHLSDFDYKRLGNDFRAPGGGIIPSVAYMVDGEDRYAHVFDPSIPAGELHTKNEKKIAKDAREIQSVEKEVKIRLAYRSAHESHIEKELLAGSWQLEDLIGSTLSLQFLNNMDFKQQATHTISQIKSFTPSLSLQKIGADTEFMQARSVMGDPINLSGKVILEKEEEQSQKSEKSLLPGNTEKVTGLKINAIPLAFPEVRLEIFPTDADGKNIEGLTAANFQLTDNKNSVVGRMDKNVISPRVMVLYDTSLSMPHAYRKTEYLEKFKSDLEASIRGIYPAAEIKLQETGSDIYTSLLRAKQSEFDLIMYATDGDNNDKFNANYLEVYNSGQPMLILEVVKSSHTYDELKKNISNLISIPAVDQEAVLEEVKSILSELTFPPYVMTYHSFAEKEEHTLKVKINDKELSDQAIFRFPERNDVFLGERIVGLYLTLESKGVKVRRTLAGWDTELTGYKPSRDFIDEVHEMFLGGALMAFEGEAPSLSIRLTEYLTAMLSHEKWFNAYREGDSENAVKFLEEGTLNYPPMLLSMMQPLYEGFTKDTITFPSGFRSCMIKLKPGLYSPNSTVSFDYLPTSNYFTFSRSGEGKTNFTETMKKTMQFAVLESEMFQDSTLTQLKDKKLLELVKARKDSSFNNRVPRDIDPVFPRRIFRAGEIVFFDDSLTSTAYFKINKDSGELHANLPDGSGGGGTSIEAQLNELGRVIKEYERVVALMQLGIAGVGAAGAVNPIGGFALGVVANYGVTLVKLYAAVSETIILMDAGNLDDQIAQALAELACNVYKDIVYLGYGKMGDGMAGIENLIGALGGEFSFIKCSV